MTDPLKSLLEPQSLEANLFPPTSRYHGLPTSTLERAGAERGEATIYLRRRFVPPPERFADLTWHNVKEDERIDTVAALHLGDPEQFWRLADANRAMDPQELTAEVGRRLRVTLPEGIPGSQGA